MMAYEHAPWRRRGRFAAIPQAGNPLGIALANIAFLAAAPLDSDWSWRIPFLASAVLIVVGLYVRLRLNESPEFEEAKATGNIVRNPFFKVIRGVVAAGAGVAERHPHRTQADARYVQVSQIDVLHRFSNVVVHAGPIDRRYVRFPRRGRYWQCLPRISMSSLCVPLDAGPARIA